MTSSYRDHSCSPTHYQNPASYAQYNVVKPNVWCSYLGHCVNDKWAFLKHFHCSLNQNNDFAHLQDGRVEKCYCCGYV